MAKRTKRYGAAPAQHRKQAAYDMKYARFHLKHMNAALKKGDCTTAIKRLSDLNFSLGGAFAQRISEHTPRQRVAMKKSGFVGAGILRTGRNATLRVMARCAREI